MKEGGRRTPQEVIRKLLPRIAAASVLFSGFLSFPTLTPEALAINPPPRDRVDLEDSSPTIVVSGREYTKVGLEDPNKPLILQPDQVFVQGLRPSQNSIAVSVPSIGKVYDIYVAGDCLNEGDNVIGNFLLSQGSELPVAVTGDQQLLTPGGIRQLGQSDLDFDYTQTPQGPIEVRVYELDARPDGGEDSESVAVDDLNVGVPLAEMGAPLPQPE